MMMFLLWSVAGKERVREEEEARIRRTDHITPTPQHRGNRATTPTIPPPFIFLQSRWGVGGGGLLRLETRGVLLGN
jgi:hypothetical protein